MKQQVKNTVISIVLCTIAMLLVLTSCKKEKKNVEHQDAYNAIAINDYIKGTWVLDSSYITIGMIQDTLVFDNGYFKTNCDIPPYSHYYRTFENDSVVVYGNDTVYWGCPIERLSLNTLRIHNYRPCNFYLEIVMDCLFNRIK